MPNPFSIHYLKKEENVRYHFQYKSSVKLKCITLLHRAVMAKLFFLQKFSGYNFLIVRVSTEKLMSAVLEVFQVWFFNFICVPYCLKHLMRLSGCTFLKTIFFWPKLCIKFRYKFHTLFGKSYCSVTLCVPKTTQPGDLN